MFIIIITLLFLIFLIFRPCAASYRTRSGRRYRARDRKTAEIIDVLRDISIHLTYNINPEDGELLRERLQNTSFKELIYQDPQIMGWNYDKGREIGIKIYTSSGSMYTANDIISTLLHELAHSLTQIHGHDQPWIEKDEYLQTFKQKYVDIFILKTSYLSNNE
tara:strand:- start:1510 stop:1998 length:489 start_codon:yes stop_codon:yes gene_type:complete